MNHPARWRDTVDPFTLPYRDFDPEEILGYPHAGNDVFHVRGMYRGREVEAFIKVARQQGADIENEVNTIRALKHPLAPEIIDWDPEAFSYVVTLAKPGARLSTIIPEQEDALPYMYEYGRTLARLHSTTGDFAPVKDRKFCHIPERAYFERENLEFVYEYLAANLPERVDTCFCHGDFHYANILWDRGHISAILDFELSGMGNREFDIAWALILRPGQKFLRTQPEIALFMEGYLSLAKCDFDRVQYYMILIYAHFYSFGKGEAGYGEYVRDVFDRMCQ